MWLNSHWIITYAVYWIYPTYFVYLYLFGSVICMIFGLFICAIFGTFWLLCLYLTVLTMPSAQRYICEDCHDKKKPAGLCQGDLILRKDCNDRRFPPYVKTTLRSTYIPAKPTIKVTSKETCAPAKETITVKQAASAVSSSQTNWCFGSTSVDVSERFHY